MLWYKGWLETRLRLLIGLAWFGVLAIFVHLTGERPGPAGFTPAARFALMAMSQMVVISSMLAGAGIATQAPFQATKGLQGSTIFTLSLPASRLHLLAIRVSVGWLEIIALIAVFCCANWLGVPGLRGTVTAAEMFEYMGTLVACTSALYFIGVLLSTFLEEQWRIQASVIAFAALWWIPNHTPLPAANIFRAMQDGSPLVAHTIPWTALSFSLALSAILFFAALKVVQAREY